MTIIALLAPVDLNVFSAERCRKKSRFFAYKKRLFLLEPPVGFEPTTCCLQNSCSNQLS